MKKQYEIKEEDFDKFWDGVIKDGNPFKNEDIVYYEHNFEDEKYVIKIK